MGCDIHLFVERRDPDSGAWVAIDGPDLIYLRHAQSVKEGKEDRIPSYAAEERSYDGWFYEGRDYTLFAILADVRNYDGITPIHARRGLPKDISPYVLKVARDYGNDGYSPSWCSYRELREYFVTHPPTITVGGLILLEGYKAFKETGARPHFSCRGAFGSGTFIIDTDTADLILSGALPYDKDACYLVDAPRPISVAEECEGFACAITDRLAPVAEAAGEENVRVVFWFDN